MVMPDCDCGTCAPTWARRQRGESKRFTQPVTLVMALEGEDAACRAAMVAEHQQCLAALVSGADELITSSPVGDPLRPLVGLGLVMFAGELASAIRPDEFGAQLDQELAAQCAGTVTAAMLAASGCLAGLVGMVQALSAIVR